MKLTNLLFLVSLFLELASLASEERDPSQLDSSLVSQKEYWLFVGNSGVGKSTLINGLMQQVVAEADVSLEGMTTWFKTYEDQENNRLYFDTPGLADIKMKERAAEEIEKALKQNGLYKIFFVITLEAGKVRPADITTINIVMNAINVSQKSYSIIINKLTVKEKKMLQGEKNQAFLYAQLNMRESKTESIKYIDKNFELDKGIIELLPLPSEWYDFLNAAPIVTIYKAQVTKIIVEDLKEVTELCEQQITVLKNTFEADKALQEKYIQDLQRLLAKDNHFSFKDLFYSLKMKIDSFFVRTGDEIIEESPARTKQKSIIIRKEDKEKEQTHLSKDIDVRKFFIVPKEIHKFENIFTKSSDLKTIPEDIKDEKTEPLDDFALLTNNQSTTKEEAESPNSESSENDNRILYQEFNNF